LGSMICCCIEVESCLPFLLFTYVVCPFSCSSSFFFLSTLAKIDLCSKQTRS
jgi:hypothetical protein